MRQICEFFSIILVYASSEVPEDDHLAVQSRELERLGVDTLVNEMILHIINLPVVALYVEINVMMLFSWKCN